MSFEIDQALPFQLLASTITDKAKFEELGWHMADGILEGGPKASKLIINLLDPWLPLLHHGHKNFLQRAATETFLNTKSVVEWIDKTDWESLGKDVPEHLAKWYNTPDANIPAPNPGAELVKMATETIQGMTASVNTLVTSAFFSTAPLLWTGIALVAGTVAFTAYKFDVARANIGKPALAIESKRTHRLTPLVNKAQEIWQKLRHVPPSLNMTKAFFHRDLTTYFNNLLGSLENIQKHNGFLPNLLLYGPGGTGKSLAVRKLLQESGMDYVVMSGGDLTKFIKRGQHVTEFNRLMASVNSGLRPTILVIDEAESVCKSRSKTKNIHRLELINALLNHTGKPSKKFMLVLITNRPEDLDSAVMNRMDYRLYVAPPALEERKSILSHNVSLLFDTMEQSTFFSDVQITRIARQCQGFTGRTLAKLINDINTRKRRDPNNVLTQEMIDLSVATFIKQEGLVKKRQSLLCRIRLLICRVIKLIAYPILSLFNLNHRIRRLSHE